MTGVLVMLANMSQQKFVTSRIFYDPTVFSFIIRAKRTKLILARIFVAFVDVLKNVNKAVMRVMARHGWPGSSFQDSRLHHVLMAVINVMYKKLKAEEMGVISVFQQVLCTFSKCLSSPDNIWTLKGGGRRRLGRTF